MKRMVLEKTEDFVTLSPLDDGSVFRVVSLADNSSDSSDENYYGPSNFNFRFDPSLVIVIFGLLGFTFFAALFFVVFCRRTSNGEGGRAGANNNVRRAAANRGLERTVIESFPVFSYNLVKGLKAQAKGSECTVCLSDFEDEEMVRLLPKCSHAFHPECIDMWLCSHTTCPVCRTSLLPGDESNPTGTDSGVVDPHMPPPQVAIVIDNGGNRIDVSSDEATYGTPEMNHDSAGHSLVKVEKELDQTTEWYIATPRGLTPGLHRTCSFVAMHHSQEPSTSNSQPACTKPGSSMDDAAGTSRSERWGRIPMNPASLLRSFSERSVAQRPAEQQDRKAYLKKTLSWLMGRDRGDRSQSGSSRYSRRADQSSQLS